MNGNGTNGKVGAALVVGGGIGGMQAALDLAESGIRVTIVDNKPSIGGVMSQLDKTFPTNDCAMCTIAPRLVGIDRHKDIEVLSLSEVEGISGRAGNFTVSVKRKARYVDEEKCTGCGACVQNCPTRNIVQPAEPKRVVVSPEFRDTVVEAVERNRNRQGPLMPILQQINSAFNYLPEDALRFVSQETSIPLSHILRVATFYSAFSIVPRGKYIVNVCLGTACYVRGSERLMDKLSETLEIPENGTTTDKLFTLKAVRCIGCCGLAPAVMVGETVHGKLTPAEVPDIITTYRGQTSHA
jgi:NADH:ubiquinone oxidoreductase subunit E/NAD-dependent dihydropyrimidine dehydrogenase PreA subunit